MNKKRYIKPSVETFGLTTEGAFMQTFSYDNTGNDGSDGEKGEVIDGDLEKGDEVGAKNNYGWDDAWD